jgi:translation initiation factor IF-3
MLGIMPIQTALAEAEKRDLDLIEVAPDAKPPVCRIIDYGKFRYEQRKKVKDAQKKSKQNEIKGIRVRPNTDDHDLDFKARNALKFLRKGDKVKFTVIFRGPELRHKEIGQQQLEGFISRLTDYAIVDQPIRMEGRRMTMMLEPKKVMPPEPTQQGASTSVEDEDATMREQEDVGDLDGASDDAEPEDESPALEEEPDDEAAPEAGERSDDPGL